VVVEISDIYIVLRPKKLVEVTFLHFNSKWDANKENEKVQTSKQQKLEMYDLIKAEEKKETQENQGESLLKKLTNTIINNIQVTVNNVHIRYEDVSVPNVSYFFIITHRIQLLLGSL
jgi:vacuolar protein sorting-associated protein 13A/C